MTSGVPLVAACPQLTRVLEDALREQGEAQLADQVGGLRVTEVCRCDRPYCGSFWTARLPITRWFLRGRQVPVGGDHPGQVTLDVVRGEIAYVEVLWWDDVRDALATLAR